MCPVSISTQKKKKSLGWWCCLLHNFPPFARFGADLLDSKWRPEPLFDSFRRLFFFLTTFDPFCWLSNRFFFLLKLIHLTDLTALQLALNKLGCFIGKKDCFLLANVRRLLYEFFFTPTPSNGSRSFGEVPHCQMVEHVPVILATVRIWVEFRMSRMSQNVHFASKCHFI